MIKAPIKPALPSPVFRVASPGSRRRTTPALVVFRKKSRGSSIPALVACSESVFIRVHPWFRSFVYALLFRFPFAIVRVLFAIIRIRSRTFAIIRDISTPPSPQEFTNPHLNSRSERLFRGTNSRRRWERSSALRSPKYEWFPTSPAYSCSLVSIRGFPRLPRHPQSAILPK